MNTHSHSADARMEVLASNAIGQEHRWSVQRKS